jgi:hypothetical protein
LRAAALIEASIKRDAGRARRCLIVPSLFAGFGGRPSQLELAGNTMNNEILVYSESLSLAAMTVSENCSVSILLPNPMFTILLFGWINAANRVQTLPGKGWSGLLVSMARRNHGGGV